MKKGKLRVLSFVLAFLMIFSSVDVSVLAADVDSENVVNADATDSDDEYKNQTNADSKDESHTADLETDDSDKQSDITDDILEGDSLDESISDDAINEEEVQSDSTSENIIDDTEEQTVSENALNDKLSLSELTSAVKLVQETYYVNDDGTYDIFFIVGFPGVVADTDAEIDISEFQIDDALLSNTDEVYEIGTLWPKTWETPFKLYRINLHGFITAEGNHTFKVAFNTDDESLKTFVNGYIKGGFKTSNAETIITKTCELNPQIVYVPGVIRYSIPSVTFLVPRSDDWFEKVPKLVDKSGKEYDIEVDTEAQVLIDNRKEGFSKYKYSFDYNNTTYTVPDGHDYISYSQLVLNIDTTNMPSGSYDLVFKMMKSGREYVAHNAIEIVSDQIAVYKVKEAGYGKYLCDSTSDYLTIAVHGVNIPDDLIPEFYLTDDFDSAKLAAVYDLTDPNCAISPDLGNMRVYKVRKTDAIKGKSSGKLYFKFAGNAKYDGSIKYVGDNIILDSYDNPFALEGSFQCTEITHVLFENGATKRIRIYFTKNAFFSDNPVGEVVTVSSYETDYFNIATDTCSQVCVVAMDSFGEYYVEVPGASEVFKKIVSGGKGRVKYGNFDGSNEDSHIEEGWVMNFTVDNSDVPVTVSNLSVSEGQWVLRFPDMTVFKKGVAGDNLLSTREIIECSMNSNMILEVTVGGVTKTAILVFETIQADTIVIDNGGNIEKDYVAKGDTLTLSSPSVPTQYEYDTDWIANHTFEGWYALTDTNHVNKITEIKGVGGKNIQLAAYWKPTVYDIYIDGENGVRATVSYDDTVSLTEELIEVKKNGYKFAGYSKPGIAGQVRGIAITFGNCKYYGQVDQTNKTITFEKRWEIENYTITYHLGGIEAVIGNQYKSYNIESPDLTLPDINGAELDFLGWYLDEDCTIGKKINEIPSGSFGNLDLYAKWDNPSYTLKFNDNAFYYSDVKLSSKSKAMANIDSVKCGQFVNLPASTYSIVSTKTSNPETWVFAGWSTYAGGTVQFTDKERVSFKKSDIDVNGEITLFAIYAKQLEINYEFDGGSILGGPGVQDFFTFNGTKTYKLPTPVKVGYDFQGWYDANGKKVTTVGPKDGGSVTVYAKWKERVFKLVLNPNGGKEKTVTVNVPYSEVCQLSDYSYFTRNGYEFAGWYYNPDIDPESAKLTIFQPSHVDRIADCKSGKTFTLKAKWKLVTSNITYLDEDESSLGIGTYQMSSVDQEITLPVKAGYTFAGWFYDNESYKKAAGSFKNGKYMLKKGTYGNLTLYAKWTRSYTLVLHVDSSDPAVVEKYTGYKYDAAKVIPTPKAKKDGMIIAGWATSSANANSGDYKYLMGDKIFMDSAIDSSNELHLYALWTPKQYKIIYYDNTLYPYAEKVQIVNAGKPAKVLKNTFKNPGYGFLGWGTISGVVDYHEGDMVNLTFSSKNVNGVVELWPTWEKEMMIIFEANALDAKINVTSMKYTYGYAINEKTFANISVPTRNGYDFAGWYLEPECKTAFKKVTKTQVGTVRLFAKWVPSSYTVIFNANVPEGAKLTGKMNIQKRTYLKEAALTKNSYKIAGYEFEGWAEGPFDPVKYSDAQKVNTFSNGSYSSSVTLYAIWKPVEYRITYINMDGFKNTNPDVYTTDTGLELNNPERMGYVFRGWYTDKAFKNRVTQIPAGKTGNITLYAKWQEVKY